MTSGSAEVDAWMAGYDNPQKDLVQRVREVILAADPRIGECVKWQAPTFTYKGNIASFFPRAKEHVSLMFHTGAKIPGTHPVLEGGGDTARYVRFESAADVKAKCGPVTQVIRSWCSAMDEG